MSSSLRHTDRSARIPAAALTRGELNYFSNCSAALPSPGCRSLTSGKTAARRQSDAEGSTYGSSCPVGSHLVDQAVSPRARSRARNAAPAAFLLPALQPPFVHQVLMGEHDDFQPHFTVHEGLPGTGPDSAILLDEDNGLLQVQLTVTPFGMPRRWRRPPAVRIAPGDWLRWQINYRFYVLAATR